MGISKIVLIFICCFCRCAYADEAAESRDDKIGSISIVAAKEILGSFDGDFIGTSSFGLGYRYSENWDFYLTRLFATNYLFGTDGRIELTGTAVGARYFINSTFFVKGGVSQQKITRTRDDWKVGMTLGVIDIAIGNQIYLGRFTLGVDWVGYSSVPFTSSTDEDIPSVSNASSYSTTKSNIKNNGRLRGPNFYLGYSF